MKMTLVPFNEVIIADFAENLDSANPQGESEGSWGDEQLGAAGSATQFGSITIATDGTFSFGTRAEASQQWWQVGNRGWTKTGEISLLESARVDGDILNDGTLATLNADAFNFIRNVTARTGSKAGVRSGFAYESSDGEELVGAPAFAALQHPTTTRAAFWGYTARWTNDLDRIRTMSYDTTDGTLNDGDNSEFIAGEAFTGTKGTGGSITGYVIKYDTVNVKTTLFINESFNSAASVGATITGSVSGVTLTFDGVYYRNVSAMKMTRSDSNPGVEPTSPEISLALTPTSTGQHIVDITTSDFGSDDERPQAHKIGSSDWEAWAFLCDWTGSTYDIATYRGSDTFTYQHTNPNALDFSNSPYDIHHILIAFDWAGGTNDFGHIFSRMKDPHFDYELAHVQLGDNATFSNCSVGEVPVARSTAWSATNITVTLNYGEIPPGTETFVFIFNASGVCVNPTSGLSIGNAP